MFTLVKDALHNSPPKGFDPSERRRVYIKIISMNIRNSLILLMFFRYIENAHKTNVLCPDWTR